MGRQADVKGDNAGGGKQRQLFAAPVIIAKTAVLIVPQIAVNRRPPILSLLAEGRFRLAIALQAGEVGDGRLQLEQEGVQVDGDKLRGADTGQSRDIPQPAAGVVPAGRGARPQVAVDFIGRPSGVSGGLHVLAPRFIPRRVPVVPVAIEQGAIRHAHHVPIRLMRDQRLGAVHPEGMLHLQMIQIALRAAHAVLFKEFDHQGEHRGLRAAEVVGAVAVRNVTVGFNQPGEVIGHAFQQIFPAALRQPQHGEIRVPVIGFAKATAGHDIGLRQRQQR